MATTWRAALQNYVQDLNRMEAERTIDPNSSIAQDSRYLQRRGTIFARLNQTPSSYPQAARSETRAAPVSVHEQDRLAVVRLRLRKRWTFLDERIEERVEHETITLTERQGRWNIAKIETEVPERALTQDSSNQPPDSMVPYINRDVLTRRPGTRALRYNRAAARSYAEQWWNSYNPKYHTFEVDCTSFVSQCLFAGGFPMNYTGKRASGWWYEGYAGGSERWSYSWAVAHSLQTYVLSSRNGLRGTQVSDPRELTIGDMISYDWDGDARFTHTTIVTGFDPLGFPLVNAHTNNSRMRYWDYRDSYAWTEATRYTFIRITDYI